LPWSLLDPAGTRRSQCDQDQLSKLIMRKLTLNDLGALPTIKSTCVDIHGKFGGRETALPAIKSMYVDIHENRLEMRESRPRRAGKSKSLENF
jgi:hypothetical protein